MSRLRRSPRRVRATWLVVTALSVGACGARSQPVPDAASAGSRQAAAEVDADAVRGAVARLAATDTATGRCGQPVLLENGGEVARYTCTVTLLSHSGRTVGRFGDHVDCVITPEYSPVRPENCFAGASAGNARPLPPAASPAG